MPDLNDLSRSDLNAIAAEHGVSDPDSLPNKPSVIAALRERVSEDEFAKLGGDEDTKTNEYPKVFWLAGPAPQYPNPRIPVLGERRVLHFRNGRLEVQNAKEEELVRKGGFQFFEEDIPKNKAVKPCPQCGYAPRSNDARVAHEELHPVFS